jgi:hypothetical protein
LANIFPNSHLIYTMSREGSSDMDGASGCESGRDNSKATLGKLLTNLVKTKTQSNIELELGKVSKEVRQCLDKLSALENDRKKDKRNKKPGNAGKGSKKEEGETEGEEGEDSTDSDADSSLSCYMCGKKGHWATFCPLRIKREAAMANSRRRFQPYSRGYKGKHPANFKGKF